MKRRFAWCTDCQRRARVFANLCLPCAAKDADAIHCSLCHAFMGVSVDISIPDPTFTFLCPTCVVLAAAGNGGQAEEEEG